MSGTDPKLLKRHPFLPVLVLAVALLPMAHVMTASDAGVYLSTAKDFLDGQGYHSTRINSFFIAIAFWLGGVSIASAYWVNRIFWLLTIVVSYFLGKELFDSRSVGTLAAVLLLSSYVFNYWVFRMSLGIDIPQAFFCNLFLLLAVAAIKRSRPALFGLAGLSMCFAFLVKETSVLFFGAAIVPVLFLKGYWTRRWVAGILVMALAAAACYLLLGVGANLGYTLDSAVGIFGKGGGAERSIADIPAIAERSVRGLKSFLGRQVIGRFGWNSLLFCLVPFVGIFAVFAKTHRFPWLVYWSVMVPTGAAMVGFGILNMRFGQVLPQFVLSYVFASAVLVDGTRGTYRRLSDLATRRGLHGRGRILALSASLIFLVLIVELRMTVPFWKANSGVLNGFPDLRVSGEVFTSEMESFARWVDETTDQKAVVMMEAPGELVSSARFFTRGDEARIQMFLPWPTHRSAADLFVPLAEMESAGQALALWLGRQGLMGFSRNAFLNHLQRNNARYYLLSTMCPAMTAPYIQAASDRFTLIDQAFDGAMTMRMYRVEYPETGSEANAGAVLIIDTSGWTRDELAAVECAAGRPVVVIRPESIPGGVGQAAAERFGGTDGRVGRITVHPGNRVFYLAALRTASSVAGYDRLVVSPDPGFSRFYELRTDTDPVDQRLFVAGETPSSWQATGPVCRQVASIGPEVVVRWHLDPDGGMGFTLDKYVQLSF